MDLARLAEPFSDEDIEWRVSQSGLGRSTSSNSGRNPKGIYCKVLAYVTARAIQKRLDDVCGPENWRTEQPVLLDLKLFDKEGKPVSKSAFAIGLSIRIDSEWVTKWDVCEPTNIEPAKGGFSGGEKRAGAQWGIGRYLYRLDETFAEVSEQQPTKQWHWAKLSKQDGGGAYYWKDPVLPAWATPEIEAITEEEFEEVKQAWRAKFATDVKNNAELREGFKRFVRSISDIPVFDVSCWTRDVLERCQKRITMTTDPAGPDSDIPFHGATT